MERFSFEQIINQVSISDLEAFDQRNEKITDSRITIATFARWISKAHVGWNHFSEVTRANFKERIVTLYHNPPKKEQLLLQQLERILITTIPDHHTFILGQERQRPFTEREYDCQKNILVNRCPKTSVGENLAYLSEDKKEEKGISTLVSQGKDMPILIGEKQVEGQKIGIVALTKCPQPKDTLYNFSNVLGVIKKKLPQWNGIILDVRGNGGGNSQLIQEVIDQLCGGRMPPHQSVSMRLTPETILLHQKNYKRDTPNSQKEEILNKFYQKALLEQTQEITSVYRQEINMDKSFNYPIYVLTDRKTASSAEYVLALKHHPQACFVGENTRGMCAYGDVRSVCLPNGFQLQLGIKHFKTFNYSIECIGNKPDIETKGQDSYIVALRQIIDKLVHINRRFSNGHEER